MSEFKNVKVPNQTHELMVLRAKALGLKKFVLADALIKNGLAMSDEAIQKAVVNAQLTQPSTDTTQARKPA